MCRRGRRWVSPHPLWQQPSVVSQRFFLGAGVGTGDAGSPHCRSNVGGQPCPAPCPAGAVRASSIFPILSVGLLFFGGLCVAASEFYKSKHNVILSAGIFFVSAGRSCPAVSGAGRLSWRGSVGRTQGSGRRVVGPPRPLALRDSGVCELSCPSGKILIAGVNQQRILPSGHRARQHLRHPPCSAPSSVHTGAAAQGGLPEGAHHAGGAPHPRAGFGGALPRGRSRDQAMAGTRLAAPGTGQQAEGLPQSHKEKHSFERPFLLDYSFLCALFPNASTDYRMRMSLSQGTALFCGFFLLPTKRQITLPFSAGRSC